MIYGSDDKTPCYDDPYPFDVLMDYTTGPEWQLALLEASEMCAGCPVRIRCHTDNEGEPWVEPVRRKLAGRTTKQRRRK